MTQLTHYDFKGAKHPLDIVVLCDNLVSPANVGAVLRLADAFGARKVIFLKGVKALTRRSKSVSRGTEAFVNIEFSDVPPKFEADRFWFNLELTTDSTSLSDLQLTSNKIGIVIGNEIEGVSLDLLQKHPSFHIKMFGKNSSMNVASALSVALYHCTQNF